MIRYTVLGSGTGIPSPVRASPSHLLRWKRGSLLLDCGPGALRQAAAAGVGAGEIDAIVLTHFHPDHVMDLRSLFFCLKNRKLYGGRGPLTVVAPAGFSEILESWWSEPGGEWLTPADHYEFALREIQPGEHEVRGLRFEALRMAHTPQSLGYRVRESAGGPVFAYSGDTGSCPEAVELGRGASLFVLECSHSDREASDGHLTPGQAGEIAAAARPARLVLTHFYPDVEPEPIEKLVGRSFSGPVERAVDGATFEL
jgi:ribonuclease BN (tRNA processing enzyme)